MKSILCILFGHVWTNNNGQIVCKRCGQKR